MKRTISSFGLLLTSISAIIGSGWLFSAYYTATIAGPSAIISWIIGGVAICIVAFVFAEICSMIPITGSSTRIPQLTHGTTVSFMFSWMIWLSYLTLMSTEVQAVIQYASFYFPYLTGSDGALTSQGYLVAGMLMFIVSFINSYSIIWLIRFNSTLTIIGKILIPLFIVLVILLFYFHPHNVIHPDNSCFMPMGCKGVLSAITVGGILFSFNGFKQAAEMAGEAHNPGRALPFAIIGSIVFCLILFVLIQIAFLSSLDAQNLVHGWHNLALGNDNSPLASIIKQDKLGWLIPFLYVSAIIAPLAAGLMYCSSAARSLYGMSKNGYLPDFVRKLSPQGNPIYAIFINFIFGMMLFLPLPGWQSMVEFLSSLLAISYAIGPICLLALRYQAKDQPRPFRLPLVKLWAYVSFYICTMLAYWAGWNILYKFGIAVGIGLALLVIYQLVHNKKHPLQWRASIWMWPYFVGLLVLSYLGQYTNISLSIIMIIMAIFCAICLWLAMVFKLPAEQTQAMISELDLASHDSSN